MLHISPKELADKLAGQQLFLIDVRQQWERDEFNIGGLHIPLDEVMQHTREIPKDKPVIIYCRKGIRSRIAIQRLEAQGYNNLVNLDGGLEAYKRLLEKQSDDTRRGL